jgi:hypothetical protein
MLPEPSAVHNKAVLYFEYCNQGRQYNSSEDKRIKYWNLNFM